MIGYAIMGCSSQISSSLVFAKQTCHICLLAAGLILAGPAPAGANAPSDNDEKTIWVLPPKTAELLKQAFKRAEPALRLESAQITMDRVHTMVCAGKSCHQLLLTYPYKGCPGFIAGPWCIERQGRALLPNQRRLLQKVLGRDRVARFWMGLTTGGEPEPLLSSAPAQATGEGKKSSRHYFLALVYLSAPVLLGYFLAFGWRRHRGRGLKSRWAGMGCILMPLAAALALVPALPVAFWDLVALSTLLGAGLLLGARDPARPIERRKVILLAASSLIALILAEVLLRWLGTRPPEFSPVKMVLIKPSPRQRLGWVRLYPRHYPAEFNQLIEKAKDHRHRVLHVGDSMVEGVGVTKDKRFTALLSNWVPQTAHLNISVDSTGTDFHYLMIRRWLALLQIDHVVQYVFPTNDLQDLDSPHPSCNGEPLLRDTAEGLAPRCVRPLTPRYSIADLYIRSFRLRPAPYPLLVAAQFSYLARHVCALSVRRLSTYKLHDDPRSLRRFAQVMGAIKEHVLSRKTAYTIIVLPYRSELIAWAGKDAPPGRRPPSDAARICSRLHHRTFNAWDLLLPLVKKNGADFYFADNIHLSANGHQVVAKWIQQKLAGTPGFPEVSPDSRHLRFNR